MENALYVLLGVIIGIAFVNVVLYFISSQGEYSLVRMVDDDSGNTYSIHISLMQDNKLRKKKMIILLHNKNSQK